MKAKKMPAKKAAKKTAKKTTIKRYVPPGKLAKKTVAAATPKPAKKAVKVAAKKTAAKKAAKPAPVAKKTPVKVPAKKVAPAKPKAPQSDKPIDSARLTQNGVTQPGPRSIAGEIWAITDDLKSKLGRNPARFEVRKAVEDANTERINKGLPALVAASVSFQYFKWRTFNNVAGREVGLYPKRNSFDLSVPVVRTPRTPKTPVKTLAIVPVKKPAPTAKKAAPVKTAAKKSIPAKKAAKTVAIAKPAVSSRLAQASAQAAAVA